MGDKIRGAIAILVGAFGVFRSLQLWRAHIYGWTLWFLLAAGLILIVMGVWRVGRKPDDPASELLK